MQSVQLSASKRDFLPILFAKRFSGELLNLKEKKLFNEVVNNIELL